MLLGIIISINIVKTKISLGFSKIKVLIIRKTKLVASIVIVIGFKILRIYLN